MKLIGPILLLLAVLRLGFASDDVLRIIEYQASVKAGVFTCVFYDIAPSRRDNELDAILKSPRLDNVAKFLIGDGFDRAMLQDLPWNPTMLLVHAGKNFTHLDTEEVEIDIISVLFAFNPVTKVLVLVDNVRSPMAIRMLSIVYKMNFTSSVYVDSASSIVLQMNGEIVSYKSKLQHAMFWFSWNRRWYRGRSLIYMKDDSQLQFTANHHWINETARYLNTDVVQYPKDCESYKSAEHECAQLMHDDSVADISFMKMYFRDRIPRDFSFIFTNMFSSGRIAVPRDRPMNTAEMLTMPFSWQVWTAIITIFLLAEILKRLAPNHFRNDPILLAVYGYERHDLHRAGRLEKIAFLSLIVFVFFLSNAFETKIVSLMVNIPSIQRIKTLDDFIASGLKLRIDIENNPHLANHSFFGKIVTDGDPPTLLEIAPNVALYWAADFVDLYLDYKFDYERMQPYYVLLDFVHTPDFEMYQLGLRSIFRGAFHYVHITLFEAGLMDLWKRQAMDQARTIFIGRRPRKNISEKVVLTADDMKPAWMVLAVGLSLSIVEFLGEHAVKRFHSWRAGES